MQRARRCSWHMTCKQGWTTQRQCRDPVWDASVATSTQTESRQASAAAWYASLNRHHAWVARAMPVVVHIFKQLQFPPRPVTHAPGSGQAGRGVATHTRLRVSVAVLLELTELAKPVEVPCLRCNTHQVPKQASRQVVQCPQRKPGGRQQPVDLLQACHMGNKPSECG